MSSSEDSSDSCSTFSKYCFGRWWDIFAVRVTPCPVEATHFHLKAFNFEILHCWFCSLLKSDHCYHNNNNGCIVPLVPFAGSKNTVLSLRDMAVETAEGSVVVAMLLYTVGALY